MNDTFKKLLAEYDYYITVKGFKSYTTYIQAVTEFLSFQTQRAKKDIDFNQADMMAYHQHLITRKNKRRSGTLSQSSINHHLYAIRLLFDYMIASNKVDALPRIPKFQRNSNPDMEILTVEQIKAMYKACRGPFETALISTAYGTGLRRSEIRNLNIEDVLIRDAILIVKQGKNSKRREVPMSNKVVKDLKDYLHNHRSIKSKDRKAFFINQIGRRVSGNTLNSTIKRIATRARIDQSISLHTLRRSIATHLAENGAGIYFIKEFLGHSHIDTSHLYAIKRRNKSKLKQS